MSFGCPQAGHALVEGVGAFLNLDFSVSLVRELGEARVLWKSFAGRGPEGVARGGENGDGCECREGVQAACHEILWCEGAFIGCVRLLVAESDGGDHDEVTVV